MSPRRGVVVFVIVLTLLGTLTLWMSLRLRSPDTELGASSLLVFDLPADLPEDEPPSTSLSWATFRRDRPTLLDVTRAIRRAADDDHVEGLLLRVANVDWGWAKVHEVRDAISAFRESGKPVVASVRSASEAEYLLASGADLIALAPTATLQLDGLSASAMFYRGTYDKVGISPNFEHIGRYKSGVERYTREDMSPETREALGALLDDELALFADSVGTARGVTSDSVRRWLDEGPYEARAAFVAGLVDTLLDPTAADSMAAESAGGRLSWLPIDRYIDRWVEPHSGDEIAIVVAAGEIMPGKSRGLPWEGRVLGSETLIRALRDARERRSVRAIVLRVDSPGGSGQASDEIWSEVRRCRESKPVVVSMSDLAASGGYYIACGADRIVAEPSTITGSIGVYGGKLNVLGLYRKLGLNVETLSRGRHAEMLSPYRDFSPEEAERFRRSLESFYATFLDRVAEGRSTSPSAVDSIGQGRVWSGLRARQLGLVDSLGGLECAIAIAKGRARIASGAPVTLRLYPRRTRTFLQRWLSDVVDDEDADFPVAIPPELATWVQASRFPAGAVLALVPFTLRIR